MDEALDQIFRTLLRLDFDCGPDGEPRPVTINLAPDGKRAWTEFYNVHARETAALTGDLAACWSKLEAAAARLALVVHLVRWASDDPKVPSDSTLIDGDSVRAGVKLARWFGREAKRVYAALAESDDDRKLKGLVAWIRSRGGSTTIRDLQRGGPREFREATAAGRALSELVGLGVGRWATTRRDGPGRPTDRFELADGPETDPPRRQNLSSQAESRIVSHVAIVASFAAPPGPDDDAPPLDVLQDAADAALGEPVYDVDGVDD
ncbi:MAG: DUF3987 domain-containing protein [Phycisphaerales bacterium]|nr:DUF3987 domain-containing protein [Phycisphaerales bacterium]